MIETKLNRIWHNTIGGHPKGRNKNVSRYMYTINSGHSNQTPSGFGTLTSTPITPVTAATTNIDHIHPCSFTCPR